MEIEVSDEITCTLCGSFLSVSPIMDVEDIGMVCGRCQDSIYMNKTNPKIERQSLYEKLASSKRFPCKYNLLGCVEKPKWNDVIDHEKSCSFGIIACFDLCKEHSKEICEWRSKKEYFILHFVGSHPEYFVTQPKVALKEILTKEYCMLLTEYSKTFIFFRFVFDEETDSICVMAVTDRSERAKDIHYELKMSDDEKKSISFSEYSVLNCLYIGADVKKFGYKIKMSLIRNFSEFDYISINIGSRKSENITEMSCVSSSLKCDNCKKYLVPPSYFYFDETYRKHKQICLNCSPQLDCSKNHETYNFMSFYTKFPCINSSRGCNFIYSYSDATIHQYICPLNIRQCFFCDWKGKINALEKHISEKHEISEFNIAHKLTSGKLLFLLDEQFLSLDVKSVRIGDSYSYEFIVQSEPSEKLGYKYEIEIFSEELISTKLSFQQIADNKLFYIFDKNEKCRKISVPLDLLEQLFPITSHLKFEFNVSKLIINK
ncbi:hypothetical protein WA026_020438 [Henosepilachna vigintioctopunctata]|uniref:SIAH-type domain-containing protein n=1 Tax=Henosepilachna vigintioctopunctata TaxID=420089 RepID=A0AAW1UNK0_9CUCU